MKEEQIRDEMRKIAKEIVGLAKEWRLPLFCINKASQQIEKELAGPMDFSRGLIGLIGKVIIKVKNSNLTEQKEKAVIRHIERLRNQHNRLLRDLHFGHLTSSKTRGR